MNPVIHFEMPYENRERMAAFYHAAFGWKIEMLGEEMGHYVMVTTAEKDARPDMPAGSINGGFYSKADANSPPHPSIVIGVGNLQVTMEKVSAGGGTLIGEPYDIPGVGKYISFTDTEGNRVGLLQTM